MKPADYLKAALAALAIMATNVAISFGVVAVYSYLVDPGHDAAYYETAAGKIAPWSSVVFGALLFYVFARVLAGRRTGRSPIAFALTMFGVYAALDLAVLVSANAFPEFALVAAISLSTNFLRRSSVQGPPHVRPRPPNRALSFISLAQTLKGC